MRPYQPIITPKSSALQMIIAISALILFFSESCFSQSDKTGQTMNSNNTQIKNETSVYLDKNDPIFISINSRAGTDLKQSANPESPDNKSIEAKINTWTEEKQNQFEALFVKTINDYNAQTNLEPGIFNILIK